MQLWNVKNSNPIDGIQEIVSKYAGIVKTNSGIKVAMDQLLTKRDKLIPDKVFDYDHFEAAILLDIAILLLQDAQFQKSNKGVFYNVDLV